MGQCWHKARAEGSLEGTTSLRWTLSAATEGPQCFCCGGEGAPSSSNPARSSEYFSARIQEMIESRGEYATAVDSEIKASEVHWSELPEMTESDKQRSAEADKAFFHNILQQQYTGSRWYFFQDWSNSGLELGEKIAEGAQGAIYALKEEENLVVKVFKAEAGSLEALHEHWPPALLQALLNGKPMFITGATCSLFRGVLLNEGKFGFVMPKFWGDLRKMIDGRMVHNGNRAPPFGHKEGFEIMYWIALGMRELHKNGIVHRDLKASNVLVQPRGDSKHLSERDMFHPLNDSFGVVVADFESSAMTVGTTFWRAPEILTALKNRSFEPNVCTEKSDVYSFGMTCYEIVTGKIPYEGVLSSNYDIVLGGRRPKLPNDIYPWIRSMIDRCWQHAPAERPLFEEIVEKFGVIEHSLSHHGEILDLLKRKF